MSIRLLFLLGLALFPLLSARAGVITLTTAAASRPNTGEIRAFLGPVGAGGPLLATLGGLTMSGTAVLDVTLDAGGNGTARLLSTNLAISDVPPTTVDLGSLGSVSLLATGLKLNIQTAPLSVLNNHFTVTAATAGGVTVNGGSLVISNTTGLIGALLPGGYGYDFDRFPLFNSFILVNPPIQGTIVEASGQTTLTLGFPEFAFNNPIQSNGVTVGYLQFAVSAQLASVVPEIGSIWFVGLLLIAAIPRAARRLV